MDQCAFETAIGPITIFGDCHSVRHIRFGKAKESSSRNPLLKRAARQITEYVSGTRRTFSFPCEAPGTAFDLAVRKAMQSIGYARTMSYAEIARRIGHPRAYRAVANACGRNPLPIVIPCHRVVGSHNLGGFNAGVRRKKALLSIEGASHPDL